MTDTLIDKLKVVVNELMFDLFDRHTLDVIRTDWIEASVLIHMKIVFYQILYL